MMPEFFNEMPEDLTGLGRRAAVVLPKDFGAVVAYTGLKSDWVVAEAGAGSGFMTVQLARIAKHVYSYENREEHYKVALANITKLGLDNVTLINADISTLDKNDLNLIFLDFKDSYNYIEDMHKHLRKNGWLVGYLPNIEQAKEFHLGCEKIFTRVFTITSNITHYTVRDFGCRPDNFGMIHTGFLTFAEKS